MEIDAMVVAQPVSAPLTRAAIFLIVTINPGPDKRAAVRSFCADLPALIRAVEFRDLEARLSCVMGIGSDAWDQLFGDPRPAELHPFQEIRAGPRHAVRRSPAATTASPELSECVTGGMATASSLGLRPDRAERSSPRTAFGAQGHAGNAASPPT
jgi:hypothetical protein